MPLVESSMTQPVNPYADFSPEIPFTTWFRGALSIAAVVTSILPVPVLFLGLLPAYTAQAEFLVFYAPLVCFLTFSYLLYVRDILARAMFADLLNPPAEPDLYFGEPQGTSLRRVARRVRSAVIALLPVALLLISSYCAVEYLGLMQRSVGQAVEQKRWGPAADSSRTEFSNSYGDSLTSRPKVHPAPSPNSVPPLTVRPQESADSLRRAVLRTARIDDIPLFTRLNILFIGIFLSAEIAFILMALKEYAREALGLTERDVMLGRSSTAAT
jgi:hypothetical protein